MRWLWVDRFTEFVSGSHARAVKNVALDEEVVDNYQPGFPVLPPTLILEGFAQMGGILVAEHLDFDRRVVLAKVGRASFDAPARTGARLRYEVRLGSIGDDGASVTATAHFDDPAVAGAVPAPSSATSASTEPPPNDDASTEPDVSAELMFAFLTGDEFPDQSLFEPGDLDTMLRIMGLHAVIRDAAGNPKTLPTDKL